MKALTAPFLLLILFTSCNKYDQMSQEEMAVAIVQDAVDDKTVYGASVSISTPDFNWHGAYGNLKDDQPFFIASTTKLFTTSIIYQLIDEGQLNLDDKISQYLPADIMKDLHVYKGHDYSHDITIKHLLSNTSGLPDYFEGKAGDGSKLVDEIMEGNDQAFSFEETIARSKSMKPAFEPGKAGKALYSDTNFQLLGRIIELLTKQSVSQVYDSRIIEPLGLSKTYLYTDSKDQTPIDIYYKKSPNKIPKAMASFRADGGVVSTSDELMIFIKAFFNGALFKQQHLEAAKEWNPIFSTNDYGVGIMKYELPAFYGIPVFIGHSGLSGAFAWYCPEHDMFITGTVNQLHKPGTSYRLVAKLVMQLTSVE